MIKGGLKVGRHQLIAMIVKSIGSTSAMGFVRRENANVRHLRLQGV